MLGHARLICIHFIRYLWLIDDNWFYLNLCTYLLTSDSDIDLSIRYGSLSVRVNLHLDWEAYG